MNTPAKPWLAFRRRLRPDWSKLAVALVALALSDCSLQHAVLPPRSAYEVSATIRSAGGMILHVTSRDLLLSGGAPRAFVTRDDTVDGTTAEERIRAQWRKYLRARLEDPGVSAEAQALFGGGPWCLLADDVTRIGPFESASPPGLTGEEIGVCASGLLPPPSECTTADGTMPVLAYDPPSLEFAPTPAGTMSPEELVLTIRNAGTGRLCLALPGLDLSRSDHPEYYAVDPSDCAPVSPRETTSGRAMLRADRPSCQVRVRFAPRESQRGIARLRLSTNDATRGLTFVQVSGTPIPGTLRAVAAPVCFNTPLELLPDGRRCRRNTVDLRNDGPGAVQLRSVSLPAGARGWEIEGAAPPRSVDAGGTARIPLLACSAATADTVVTVIGDGSVPIFDVALRAPGSSCGP